MKSKDQEWALFWCSLLRPVLFGEIEKGKTQSYLKGLTRKEYLFPNGKRRRPSLSTLKRKLKKYRKEGFSALARKIRSDRGKPRAASRSMVDKAIALKKDQPRRSDEAINRFLKEEFGKTIPPSTLYRHLKQAGATRIKLGIQKTKIRRRWSRDHTHDLWVGDFEFGPYVLFEGEAVKTHLSAFIDCHSRYGVEGRYYFRQNLDILIDSLLRAWGTHGASGELYVDNAKVYHAKGLKAACYALNIDLLHRPPRDPPAGGLVERFFETVQSQFEAEVRAGDILTLEQLNRAFSAWLSVSYHQRKNAETGQSPQERYEQGLLLIRHVDLDEVIRYFMEKETRRVDPDFCDIRLHGRFFRVDPKLRGDRVEVRFDPFSSLDRVFIYSLREEYLGVGLLHHREKADPLPASTSTPKPTYNYLELLIRQHEEELKAKTQGIDYRAAITKRAWPFTPFVQKFAKLLGRKGGLGAFQAEELEALKKIYHRHGALCESMLLRAFEAAEQKTIPCIAYELQQIARKKE
jgi:transposase InsO family protein